MKFDSTGGLPSRLFHRAKLESGEDLWRRFAWIVPDFTRTFQSARYLAGRTITPAIFALLAVVILSEGGALGVIIVIPAAILYIGWAVVTVEDQRAAVAILGRRPIDSPHSFDSTAPFPTRLRDRMRESATWREVAHAVLTMFVAPIVFILLLFWILSPVFLASPLLINDGPVALGPFTVSTSAGAWAAVLVVFLLIALGAHLMSLGARAYVSVTASLLKPRGDELRGRLIALARSRARLIDAFDIERRRIERDLHDGAQQQIVSLAMTLDLARIELEETPRSTIEPLIEKAHSQATETLKELRRLIDGIHPAVLSERGLVDAAQLLCDRSALHVTFVAEVSEQLPDGVSSTVYFVLAEALTNAAKHSGCDSANVQLCARDGMLIAEVTDNGRGGADPEAGTGLFGLADRVAALDGQLTLASPPGGPTVVRAKLPLDEPSVETR